MVQKKKKKKLGDTKGSMNAAEIEYWSAEWFSVAVVECVGEEKLNLRRLKAVSRFRKEEVLFFAE